MKMKDTVYRSGSVVMVLALVLLIWPDVVQAGPARVRVHRPGRINLVVGKSVILDLARAVDRVSVASPEIADFVLLSPHQLYVTGKAAGVTNLTIWSGKSVAAYDLEVKYDTVRLKRKLHELLPKEKGIRVFATERSITLSGTVSSTARLSEAMSIAQTFAPADTSVVNLLKVAGVHQVMLDVRVAEMSRSVLNRFGFNFNWTAPGGEFVTGILGGAGLPGGFGFFSGADSFTGSFDFLKAKGLIKILAEPTLVALSGQTASFLAGGEFPVPIPSGQGDIAIEYKEYGIRLTFTPTVLSEERIGIKVVPEVSEVDYSVGTTISGAAVPGITTRRAATSVELADGQSFAIAGLLRESARESVSKYPVLGDMPVLGILFKSKEFQKNESELVIIVTPHLAKPLDMTDQSLPTDHYVEPDDAEFYVWGIFGRSQKKARDMQMDGEFGHIFTK